MKENKDLKLLREFVRETLTEDDGGDVAMDLMSNAAGGMPYGMSYGGKSIFKVFVDPFVNAAKTIVGKTKEIAVHTKTFAKVIIESVISTIIPFMSGRYEKIFAEEKEQLQRIQSEYKESYDKVLEVFDHSDIKMLAFMYDPLASGAMMTYFGGKAGVQTAIGVVDVLSGGWLRSKIGTKKRKQKRKYQYATGTGMDESIHRIDEKLTLGTVKQALEQPTAKEIRSDIRNIVNDTLKNVVDEISTITNASSMEEILGMLKGKVPGDALSKFQQLPDDEKKRVETVTLNAMKKSAKELFVKNLEGQVKKTLDSGVPKSSEYVKAYITVINKIKSM